MGANANELGTTVVPAMRYRNVASAINWLCKAFEFEKHLVVTGENGAIRYAQLTFGSGMIMVGPVQESTLDKLMLQPDEIGGGETQTCYFFVEDVRTHYARAKAAGAEIVFDLDKGANAGLGYSCRDPEGHIWNFGTYNPWRRSTNGRRRQPSQSTSRRRRKRSVVLIGLGSVPLLAAVVAYLPLTDIAGPASEERATTTSERSARQRSAGEAAERAVREIRDQLTRERSGREAAERAYREASELVTRMRGAIEQAERAAQDAREQLAQALNSKEASEQSAQGARAQLTQALLAKEAAERAAKEAREQLTQARTAKDAAERASKEARDRLARERSARIAAERAAPKSASDSGLTIPSF